MAIRVPGVEVYWGEYRVCLVDVFGERLCVTAPTGLGEEARRAYFEAWVAYFTRVAEKTNRAAKILTAAAATLTILLLLTPSHHTE